MNNKMQWFKFYPKDFLDDEAVKAMDYEAKGLYIEMLCHCWTNESMPADTKKLARIFNLSNHKFNKLWDQVKEKFFEENLRFFNNRILREKKHLEKDFKQKSDSGRKGAKSRWQRHSGANGDAIETPMQDTDTDIEIDNKANSLISDIPNPAKTTPAIDPHWPKYLTDEHLNSDEMPIAKACEILEEYVAKENYGENWKFITELVNQGTNSLSVKTAVDMFVEANKDTQDKFKPRFKNKYPNQRSIERLAEKASKPTKSKMEQEFEEENARYE
jgi:uncharacterized protein YdaU (DUF1376 family)